MIWYSMAVWTILFYFLDAYFISTSFKLYREDVLSFEEIGFYSLFL